MPTYSPCSMLIAILRKIRILLDAVGDILTQPGRLGQLVPVSETSSHPSMGHVFTFER